MKVARLYVDGSMGKTVDIPEVNEIFEKEAGAELLPIEWFPATITDFTPYLLRVRDSKPDMVWCQMVGDAYALALKDAVRLGMDITNPQFLSCEWGGMTSTFVQAAGSAGEGSMSMYYYNNLWDTLDDPSHPEIQKMLDIAEKYQKTRRPQENYAKGLEFGLITQRLVERAINNTGAATKESVFAEFKKVDNEEFIMGPKITWTNGQRYGVNYNGVLVVKDGKLTPITPPDLPFTPMTKEKLGYMWKGGVEK
jgi:branched-chain amino acid transport system substrate-binding protein